MQRQWLPEPPEGTKVCLGFDGSETGDWTAIKGETVDGMLFTPRFAGRPTIWNPADSGGRIPRAEVDAAVDDLFSRFDVKLMYCDPPLWGSEIDTWGIRHDAGRATKDKRVIPFETYRPIPMHEQLERFVVDVRSGRMSHDGCPITTAHIRNARMAHRKDGRYVLEKPDVARKIDAAVTSVLAHAAAADARSMGWGSSEPTILFLP